MRDLEQTLTEHPFLKDLATEHVKLLVGCASNVAFKKGDFILREGEEASAFYFIREGLLSFALGKLVRYLAGPGWCLPTPGISMPEL